MATAYNHKDQRCANVERARDVGDSGSRCVHLAGSSDIIVADLRLGPSVESKPLSVPLIVGGRNPFQVGDSIVGFDAVNVVDLRKIKWIGDESCCDNPMNETPYGLAVLAQRHMGVFFVSSSGDSETDDLSLSNDFFPVRSEDDSVEATDTADVADFVRTFKASYGSPFLFGDDIHSTGCPSGVVGSTIKDPSHAATFGGSATMASVSVTYNRSHVDAG